MREFITHECGVRIQFLRTIECDRGDVIFDLDCDFFVLHATSLSRL